MFAAYVCFKRHITGKSKDATESKNANTGHQRQGQYLKNENENHATNEWILQWGHIPHGNRKNIVVANIANETCNDTEKIKQMMNEMENRISLKLKKNMEVTWEKFLIRQKKSF